MIVITTLLRKKIILQRYGSNHRRFQFIQNGILLTMMRIVLISIGLISVALGVLGIFLPLLPTTPFLLLAAACFAKSSKRFHSRLLSHRIFGKIIRDYSEKRGLPLKTKITTLILLWITISATAIFAVNLLVVRIVLFGIAAAITIHIATLRTLKE